MSGISISVDTIKSAGSDARALIERLTDLRGLHNAMGYAARNLTRDHLTEIASTRHDTANHLGATPSNHWGKAAENTSFESDTTSATVTINHPGIGRAFHDVDILPKGKCLTIPLIAYAYNLKAAAIWESENLSVRKSKNSKGNDVAVAGKKLSDGSFQPWYLLVPRVHQPQDRSLLPSDEEYKRAAVRAGKGYLDFVRRSLTEDYS